ncbi:hypothetical protein N9878_00600 [bacterium]|nr:hypothetical protein [bacterium]
MRSLTSLLRQDALERENGLMGLSNGTPVERQAAAEIEKLRDLINHAAIHTNYPQCGYLQMTTEQKKLFDETAIRESEKANCEYCKKMKKEGITFYPSHKPSSACQSGGRPHCTCDACF